MRTILSTILLGLLHVGLLAQESATVMSYNVLNFPTGNIAGREDTLRKLINYVQPDLFLIQELKNDSGLQLILETSFADLPAEYAASSFVPQQSNPFSSWKLQQAMVYNNDLVGMAVEGLLETEVRDLNYFKMFYRDPDLTLGADTLFFYVFVIHLKSSQGAGNEAQRLQMAQSLTAFQQTLPSNTPMIVAGDFNVYTSLELAYIELLDTTDQIVLKDPINNPGDWHSSSFPDREILTQSTRSSSIFGDGAGGGIDDRFDFILLSENMFEPWNTIVYEEGSYHAMGNTGNCYNQSITDCNDGVWPDTILNSLYYMSDHLPIVLNLNFGVGSVNVSDTPETKRSWVWNSWIHSTGLKGDKAMVRILDAMGRELYSQEWFVSNGRLSVQIPKSDLKPGLHIIEVTTTNGVDYLKILN